MNRDVSPETFECAAIAENLASARSFLRRYLAAARWDGRDLDVVIAVGEVLQNVVRHGFAGGNPRGKIHMEVSVDQGTLLVVVEDNAPPSVPSGWSSTGRPAQDGGLGLNIIHRIAADVEFAPTATGNHARLRFHPD